ncbi:hypothetical protein EJB05_38793, partial [Eragrostis curvula]
MGCFLACFGGADDRRRRRRKSRRQSPARSPPRPNHVSAYRFGRPVLRRSVPPWDGALAARVPDWVAVVRVASVAADVVVKEASPPLRGANASKPPLAVEVPDEVVRGAPAADGVVSEASRPLPWSEGFQAAVPEEVVCEASDAAVKEVSPLLHGAKASLPAAAVAVADEVVTSAFPGTELRELSELGAPSVGSLLSENKATPPASPVKCSPMVVASVCTQDLVECSPVVAAVVSTRETELRELSDHGSRSSGKKKVTFNMDVTTYENAAEPDQEEGYSEDEDENHVQKTVVLPQNHRYRNCSYDDEDVEDADEVYDDYSDEEEDYVDCKIDLLDEEELNSEDNKQESHESLFSLPMSNDLQNDDEVISPAPKSGGTSLDEESPLIKGNNLHGRSKYVRPMLNPVRNLSEWKEVKSLKTQPVPSKKLDKENVNVAPDVGASHVSNFASQIKASASNCSKKEVSVDASLSTWLVTSDNSTVDKLQSKSPCSISSVSQGERSGALTIDDLKKSSDASSPQRSPSHNREGAPIFGTVGSYWSCTKQHNEHCSSRSDSGTNGIPNTTSKYREDKRVNWHSTPFNVRLDRALKKTSS